MEMLTEFMNDFKVRKDLINEMMALMDNGSDLQHFEDKIFSPDKSFDVMVYEMKRYKLLEQPIMTLIEFEEAYNQSEITAVNKLFRSSISIEEWKNVQKIMKLKGMKIQRLYAEQLKNIERNSICNIWQLIL
ncbi:hypothetical protein P4J13_25240 [Bacillus anthracis]|uniref:hypothetical protein n=1 Tax=Bacillus anthracis TaxID=1392 RepID=UPI002DB724B3|nr:hypothetical protein [Bacillus anthracis]MEB9507239.1 hypothetical protein [Bacillus anthracis]